MAAEDEKLSINRRRLFKALSAAPVVATLRPGEALANLSAYQCVERARTEMVLDPITDSTKNNPFLYTRRWCFFLTSEDRELVDKADETQGYVPLTGTTPQFFDDLHSGIVVASMDPEDPTAGPFLVVPSDPEEPAANFADYFETATFVVETNPDGLPFLRLYNDEDTANDDGTENVSAISTEETQVVTSPQASTTENYSEPSMDSLSLVSVPDENVAEGQYAIVEMSDPTTEPGELCLEKAGTLRYLAMVFQSTDFNGTVDGGVVPVGVFPQETVATSGASPGDNQGLTHSCLCSVNPGHGSCSNG